MYWRLVEWKVALFCFMIFCICIYRLIVVLATLQDLTWPRLRIYKYAITALEGITSLTTITPEYMKRSHRDFRYQRSR